MLEIKVANIISTCFGLGMALVFCVLAKKQAQKLQQAPAERYNQAPNNLRQAEPCALSAAQQLYPLVVLYRLVVFSTKEYGLRHVLYVSCHEVKKPPNNKFAAMLIAIFNHE